MKNSNKTHAPKEYWAFISYRHSDNKEQDREWASWLHQEIERYEIPAELLGSTNNRGDQIPEKIFPVFRDEESLPADADLNNLITNALNRSKFLVALCSPSAVESRYVAQEIEHFQQTNRAERIIAGIIAGEPGDEKHECFPPPLKNLKASDGKLIEPIAADFRLPDGSQGYTSSEAYRRELLNTLPKKQANKIAEVYDERLQLMKLKIIAGILGTPLEVLRDRDKAYQLTKAKKRQRILSTVVTTVSLLAIAALLSGLFALKQQKLAEEKTELAEESEKEARTQEAIATKEKQRAIDEEQRAIAEEGKAKISAAEALLSKQKADEERKNAVAAREQTEIALKGEKIAAEKTRVLLEKEKHKVYISDCRRAADYIKSLDFPRARLVLDTIESDQRDSLWALLYSTVGHPPLEAATVNQMLPQDLRRKDFENIDINKLKKDSLQSTESKSIKFHHRGPWKTGYFAAIAPSKENKGISKELFFLERLDNFSYVRLATVIDEDNGFLLYPSGSLDVFKSGRGEIFPSNKLYYVSLNKVKNVLDSPADSLFEELDKEQKKFWKKRYKEFSDIRITHKSVSKEDIGSLRSFDDIVFNKKKDTFFVATSDIEGAVEIWDLRTNQRVAQFGERASIEDLGFPYRGFHQGACLFDPSDPAQIYYCKPSESGSGQIIRRDIFSGDITKRMNMEGVPEKFRSQIIGHGNALAISGDILSIDRWGGKGAGMQLYYFDAKSGEFLATRGELGAFYSKEEYSDLSKYDTIYYVENIKMWVYVSNNTMFLKKALRSDEVSYLYEKPKQRSEFPFVENFNFSPDNNYLIIGEAVYVENQKQAILHLPPATEVSKNWAKIYLKHQHSWEVGQEPRQAVSYRTFGDSSSSEYYVFDENMITNTPETFQQYTEMIREYSKDFDPNSDFSYKMKSYTSEVQNISQLWMDSKNLPASSEFRETIFYYYLNFKSK